MKASPKGNGAIIPELDLAQMSVLFTHVEVHYTHGAYNDINGGQNTVIFVELHVKVGYCINVGIRPVLTRLMLHLCYYIWPGNLKTAKLFSKFAAGWIHSQT